MRAHILGAVASLIEQLQADALDSAAPVTVLLRKAKATAVKLNLPEFAAWTEHELSGYSEDGEVPKYRILHAHLKYWNPYRGWCPLIGSSHNVQNGQPIGELMSLLESDSGFFTIPVAKAARHFSQKLGFPADVHSHISRTSLAGIIEAVRNLFSTGP